MRKKRKRIDTSPKAETLTESPFAQLRGMVPDALPEAPPEPKPAPEPEQPDKDEVPYDVGRTKKGGYPIAIEKRAKGKMVTVIRHVSGDIEQLVRDLRKHCGTGGTFRDDAVELQGDHRDAIEAFLKARGL